ncbi:MAG: hypothetical protein NTZ09_13900 [Candidatus Hydrogenedentes bacterium]|nr:hypothetical protein [Candidatus Hydrogenedentota bacterium]
MGRFLCLVVLLQISGLAAGEGFDGYLRRGDERFFPIGFYDMPEDEAGLREMAEAGVNLVHCHSAADLDRAQAAGLQGVVPLPLDNGATEELREQVTKMAGHPALAVWEGPDEVVWNFTAFSGLYKTMGVHKESGAWWKQTPEAVAYAEQRAAEIMPNLRAAAAMIREIDGGAHPVWINEAEKSDVAYVRQYLEFVDITGCDIYPIKAGKSNPARIGESAERWKQVGLRKPVWMVLQAFSWNELGEYYGAKETAYPTFAESRLMAYDAIAHGARGILYWGGRFAKSAEFRQSLYALTAELAALQPFLTAPEAPGVGVQLVEMPDDGGGKSVAYTGRKSGEDWLIVLVNEDDEAHMGVVVVGLGELEGRALRELYGEKAVVVSGGEVVTRMLPRAVQVLCTSKAYEARRNGRTFGD